MNTGVRRIHLLFASLVFALQASAQQQVSTPTATSRNISLHVVVTTKSGPPIAGLQRGDFTLLDNKIPQTLVSFQEVSGKEAPAEVLLVIDAVNTGYESIAYERLQIDKFLRANGGHLAHPMALAVFTDTGTKVQQAFQPMETQSVHRWISTRSVCGRFVDPRDSTAPRIGSTYR